MAGNMAWKAGKGALHKYSGKTTEKDPTIRNVDNAHYRGAKVEKKMENGLPVFILGKVAKDHRKDSAYYEYKGIPEKDAKILSSVVQCARFLDNGIRVAGFKFGVNTFVELIPGVGDFIGTGLSLVLVVVPALRVSKGSDKKKLKRVLVGNSLGAFLIGITPIAGDIIDSYMKFNVRSSNALEAMLLKRVDEAAKTGRDAEKVGRTTGYQHAGTNGHNVTATNGYHDSESSAHPPRRYITANDLGQDPRPAATVRAPVVETQSKKIGGNFFRRQGESRGGPEVGTTVGEVAPARPLRPENPRPEHSRHERSGHF